MIDDIILIVSLALIGYSAYLIYSIVVEFAARV